MSGGRRGAQQRRKLIAAAARERRTRWLRRGALVLGGLAAVAIAYSLVVPGGGSTPSGTATRPQIGGDLHSLVVDPANPDRVMVGGHDGGAISEDGGRSWRDVSGLKGADPMGWVIDPRDPLNMYVGGHPGFYRSQDGGAGWRKDTAGLPGTDIHGLGIDPQNPRLLYAFVVGRGIYKSSDGGSRWELVNADMNIMGPILVDPRRGSTLYVTDMRSGFLRSLDGGATWEPLGTIPGGMAMSVAQDQQAPDTFYAANGQVLKSSDGGMTWQPTGSGITTNASAVAVAPTDSRVVYAGVLEGSQARIFRSEDAGLSWEARN